MMKAGSNPWDSGVVPKASLGLCPAWDVTQVYVGLRGKAQSGQVPVVMMRTVWRVPGCTSAA